MVSKSDLRKLSTVLFSNLNTVYPLFGSDIELR